MNVSMSSTAPTRAHYDSIENDPRWARVIARDRRADGEFFYSVATTGVYCKPSCPSRRARPENVRFHASAADAERAGFRPCQRCRPTQPSLEQQRASTIAEVCRVIDTAETAPNLTSLARLAGLSPYHFHRVFKDVTGVTPRAYAAGRRSERVRNALVSGANRVTDAIYDAGFNSGGRFYETSESSLGMTPTAYRTGGANAEIRFAVGECSLGAILVAQSAKGVCAILLGDDPAALVRDLQDRFPKATLLGGDSQFERIVAQVVGFVEHPWRSFELPLDIQGTAFQQRVWQALRKIPVGSTASYTEIARRLGMPTGARAVAQACRTNPIAIAIPCHRVVSIDGSLSGYRWGVERKRKMIEKELGAGSWKVEGRS